MIMLDTTAYIDYLNGDESIKETLNQQSYNVFVTTISIYEICIGLEKTKRMMSEKRYKEQYTSWKELLSGITIYSLGVKEAEKAAEIYDKLESKGTKIDDHDILIASIAITNGIKKILTRNKKHFQKIEEIEVIEY